MNTNDFNTQNYKSEVSQETHATIQGEAVQFSDGIAHIISIHLGWFLVK